VEKAAVSMVFVERVKETVTSTVIVSQDLCVVMTTASWVLVMEQDPKDGTKKMIAVTIPGNTLMLFVLEAKVVARVVSVMLEKAIVMLIAIVNPDLNVAPIIVLLVSVSKQVIMHGMKKMTVAMILQLIQASAKAWKNVVLMVGVELVKEIVTTIVIA